MLKEALEYVVGLKAPMMQEIYGSTYSDKELCRIDEFIPTAAKLYLNTLTGLVDYIKANIDTMADKMILEVTSPTEVSLYSQLNVQRKREYLVTVNAMVPDFTFDRFIDHESFCIGVQAKFIETEDREIMLKFAGTVENGTIAQYSDDGVTQKATIKQGLTGKAEAIIPNPVKLKPYRTFLEVDQPESDFIFRMKDACGVSCALFEADGGAWKMEAMQKVKHYLKQKLKDMPQFTVIA